MKNYNTNRILVHYVKVYNTTIIQMKIIFKWTLKILQKHCCQFVIIDESNSVVSSLTAVISDFTIGPRYIKSSYDLAPYK